MKTKINMIASHSRTAPLLALSLAALTLAAAPASTQAHEQVPFMPFKASFATWFVATMDPTLPISHITVVGLGQATHLGRSIAFTDNQDVNVVTGATTATYTLVGANGDSVVLEMTFQTTFTATGVAFDGTYVVTGGTGQFKGAEGTGAMHGSATFTSQTAGYGEFSVSGKISQPHAEKH
jgi:hypothetical protein